MNWEYILYKKADLIISFRVCEHEMRYENYDQARIICGYMLTEFPKCLPLWKKWVPVLP